MPAAPCFRMGARARAARASLDIAAGLAYQRPHCASPFVRH